jgi:hypothetical protein
LRKRGFHVRSCQYSKRCFTGIEEQIYEDKPFLQLKLSRSLYVLRLASIAFGDENIPSNTGPPGMSAEIVTKLTLCSNLPNIVREEPLLADHDGKP